MKQVKIAYDKCKKKLPNRPPDEIAFGLGFRSALEEVLKQIDEAVEDREEGIFIENIIEDWIKKELQ